MERVERRGKGERILLEEGLDLSGLLLDAGDDGLQVLVRVRVRRRRSHPAVRRRLVGFGFSGCSLLRRGWVV